LRESLLAGLLAAAVMTCITTYLRRWGWEVTDFDQLWFAGRALLEGRDPYTAWQPAGLRYPMYYPLHAILLTSPLALLPREQAWTLLAAATGFIAGYGLHRLGRWALIAMLSPVWWGAALMGQITPALVGAAMVPWFGFLLAAKPTVGLALWISRPTRQAAIGVIAFTLICFLVLPGWAASWLRLVNDAPYFRAPVTRPGGVLLLLALLRWRTPEGRLLAAWALIPRTEHVYDLLPLVLVARSAAAAALLTTCGVLALVVLALQPMPPDELIPRSVAAWPALFGLIYVPALFVVLSPILEEAMRRRPGDATPTRVPSS
jgi:hypothetical protein